MQCPACNAANPEGSYFCAACGKQVRSAFGRGEGPVQLGQAPELSAPLATVAREETLPPNLSFERPAAYARPALGGTGCPAPAQPDAPASPLATGKPGSSGLAEQRPPDSPAPLDVSSPTGKEAVPAAVEQTTTEAHAAQGPTAEASEDALLSLLQRLPPGATPFRQGMWARPVSESPHAESSGPGAGRPAAADPRAAQFWSRDIGELIGAARDRAEELRLKLTPAALSAYDERQGNTSGLGRGQPLPQAARGFSLGGLVPGGLYAFAFKNPLLGCIGLALLFFKWYPLYVIYIGVVGRQMAWQNRRFDDVAHYNRVMQRWDIAGFYMLPLYLLWWIGTLVLKNL